MTLDDLFDKVLTKAESFGFSPKNKEGKVDNPRGNAVARKNLSDKAYSEGRACFGLIRPEQNVTGIYSGYSFVVFPDKEVLVAVVGLVIGKDGFENDYELSAMPGLRRQFIKLYIDADKSFFKDDFQDKESTFSRLENYVKQNHPILEPSVKSYSNVIVACEIVDFSDGDTALERIYAWLATYAKIREVGNIGEKKQQDRQLRNAKNPAAKEPDDIKQITNLLENRKYVVLQGAPGTGKTYTALKIASKYDKVFFDQFHAETTYSDFIGGLQPTLTPAAESPFEVKDGVLTLAIKYAQDHPNERVLLIIDEINRANLANVLGPVFYLFEPTATSLKDRNFGKLKFNGLEISALPPNIDVIATMNTADRSLAVVDFALRRRFAWYTMRPHILTEAKHGVRNFDEELFNKVNEIFEKYATDAELSLQPGHSYFIFDSGNDDTKKKEKIEYELMPLIKEYLTEGYLANARTEFSELFLNLGCRLYE